jgi:kynurenine 3-monooxygenase
MKSMTTQPKRIHIIGGGLAGSLLACMLGKAGHSITVFERRPDPRTQGFIGGRSINLAISVRGIKALAAVGLAEKVLAEAIPMKGRMMHAVDGVLTFHYYSSNHREAINSVSRGGLNIAMLDAAEQHPGVKLRFNMRFVDMNMDADAPVAALVDENSGAEERAECDLLIGADGAYSAVRAVMQKREGFNYSQEYLSHGYKELSIPPSPTGEFAIEANALHIWPRGGYMMIALPNIDRSFTCTLFHPLRGKGSFEALKTRADVISFFERSFPDAVPMMPTLADDFFTNPTGALVTIRCSPWHHQGKVLLIGDAAHAIVPFYGQGMNAAFEDCVELMKCIDRAGDDMHQAVAVFAQQRKEHTDAIAEMALDNFIEMRDRVSSRAFLLRKKFEQLLHRLMPRKFMPLYNMISFTTFPYAKARQRARKQRRAITAAFIAFAVLLLAAIVWLVAALI